LAGFDCRKKADPACRAIAGGDVETARRRERSEVNAKEDSRDRFSDHLATALSLSIGWGIRGNFGHEYGAMIPGALAAMAAVLLSRRGDWVREVPFFGMFGALGWSFGGSISNMQVIAYTRSGHSPSVLYGFACLFVIGFLWAALGGAGTRRQPKPPPPRRKSCSCR
jgi:hypothetical protein